MLQGGIRGTRVIRRISRIRVIRVAKGDKGDKEDKGNREKSVCSSISTPNRTEAELHKRRHRGKIRKKKAQREVLQGGIRGGRVIRGIRGIRE